MHVILQCSIFRHTSQVIDCASAINCTLLTPKPQNKATPTTKQSNPKTKQLQCLFFQRDTRECIISNGRDTRECIISNSFFQEPYIWRSSWMKVPIPFRVLQKNEVDGYLPSIVEPMPILYIFSKPPDAIVSCIMKENYWQRLVHS